MSDPAYISLREAAERYSCSTRTLRRHITEGRLPAVYASSRMIRVREDHLEQLFSPKEGLVGAGPQPKPETQPEPVDLAHLSDRAHAYVVGLEASLKRLRTENNELRAKLNDPARADEKHTKAAYRRGWSDASVATLDAAASAVRSLTDLRRVAADTWMAQPKPTPKEGAHE